MIDRADEADDPDVTVEDIFGPALPDPVFVESLRQIRIALIYRECGRSREFERARGLSPAEFIRARVLALSERIL